MLLPIAPAGRGVSAVDGFGQPMNGAFVEAMHAGGGVAIFPREPLFGASVQPVR
jgi:hypothetical protein